MTPSVILDSLALIKSGWDVIRYHKSGICKVHGVLGKSSPNGPSFFHTSSLCGRCYMISPWLMRTCLENAGSAPNSSCPNLNFLSPSGLDQMKKQQMVPYTAYIAKMSARHLTYKDVVVTEGAFGSWNDGGGFGHRNLGIEIL